MQETAARSGAAVLVGVINTWVWLAVFSLKLYREA
jgi:hypothetical protein